MTGIMSLRDDDGAVLVEFAIVAAVFLLLVFAIVDLARLGFTYVMAEKATERAVRIAAVSPAICAGLPVTNRRSTAGMLMLTTKNGTRCSDKPGLCVDPGTTSCRGDGGNAAAAAIFSQVQPLLPRHATPANLMFSYSFDPALGRLGADYAPIVTVDLVDLDFRFITDLGAMATAGTNNAPGEVGQDFVLPSMSASLPAEDLN